MTLFETKVIKVSDFNSCHTYTENTDSKELSVVNVCFKMILCFTNWQLYELLQHFSFIK